MPRPRLAKPAAAAGGKRGRHRPTQDAGNRETVRRGPIAVWGSLGLALLFLAQGFAGMRTKSLTWDEPIYISSGHTYLVRNDFRLTPEAPPLMQELAALAVLWLDPELPPESHPAWRVADRVAFAQAFARANAARLPELARWARLPSLLLGAALVLALGLFGVRLYGPVAGLVPATVAALSPNLLAHAKLATTDLGCTAFMLLAVWSFWWATRSAGLLRWPVCGLVTGLALLTKFSALLLAPSYVALAGLLVLGRRLRPIPTLVGLTIVGAVAFLVVGAGYNLSFDYSSYRYGLENIYSVARPGYLFYLFGELSAEPWWYYALAAFVVKVPVATLGLIALALLASVVAREHREAALFSLVPALAVIGASFFDRANIGLRHILPAFPFLMLLTGQVAVGRYRRPGRWVALLLVAWLGVVALRIQPHHLAYFNELAGGPERGPYLLDDSNIDWGQDLPALARWQRDHPEAGTLKLRYFGNVPPEAYGVRSVEPSQQELLAPGPGTYAISATELVGLRRVTRWTGLDFDWLTRFRPVARAGYSIYIYRFDRPAGAGLRRTRPGPPAAHSGRSSSSSSPVE